MKIKDMWVDRYRPSTMDDICLDDSIKKRIVAWGDKIPHLLLIGPVGVGKTSIAKIIVNDVLKCDYLYINASDENGVETMRNKVAGFIQTKSMDGNLKVVLLDEADGISLDAQNLLRNMMESYSDTARFILTGNYKHKIGVPLQSRCQLLELKFSQRDFIKRIIQILTLENINYGKDFNSIVDICKSYYPDFRSTINHLQLSWIDGEFDFTRVCDTNILVEYIWNNITRKQSLQTRKYLIENESLFQSDWSRLLKDLLNYIYDLDIDDGLKRLAIITIADHLEMSTRVLDKEINLFACLLKIEEEV